MTKTFVAFDKLLADEMNAILYGKPADNLIVNGGMEVAQRGTSVSVTSGYSLDRWHISANNPCTVTQDTTVVPPNWLYSLRVAPTLPTTTATVQQAIETLEVMRVAGSSVTVSAYVAGSSAAMGDLTMTIYYSTSTDVAPTGTWTSIDAAQVTLTTSMQQISKTVAIPSTARSLKVAFSNVTSMTSTSYLVSQVMMTEGSLVQPFARAGKSYADEVVACQRYYWRFSAASTGVRLGHGHAVSVSLGYITIPFPVSMRTTPTAIETTGVASNYAILNAAGTVVALSATPAFHSATRNSMSLTLSSTYTAAGNALTLQTNAASVYLGFSAEL